MNLVFKLYRLQAVDAKLDRSQARLQEIERVLSDDQAVITAQASHAAALQELEAARKSQRQAEEKTHAQRAKIQQTEAALYGGKVRDPKELQDLQNESAALKRFLEVLEERQLEAMLAVDEHSEREHQRREQLETTEAAAGKQFADLSHERSQLQDEVALLEAERLATSKSIPDDALEMYHKLRSQRQGVAVARVNDKTCSACGSTLSASLLGEARAPNRLARCDFCSRILYAS